MYGVRGVSTTWFDLGGFCSAKVRAYRAKTAEFSGHAKSVWWLWVQEITIAVYPVIAIGRAKWQKVELSLYSASVFPSLYTTKLIPLPETRSRGDREASAFDCIRRSFLMKIVQ